MDLYVLHIITTINRGGAENHLIELVRGQRARGFRVGVAYLKGDGYWTDTLCMLGAEVFPLHLSSYGDIQPLLALRRLILNVQPSVVHAHMPPAELYSRLVLLTVPLNPIYVISKHNDEPFYKGFGSRIMGRWVARRANHLIAISNAVSRYMCDYLALAEGSITTVHYGIDPTPYREVSAGLVSELRAQWGAERDCWLIGSVARLVPQKALHILIIGYAQYRVRASKPSKLIIVGRGPLEPELGALANKLGIGNEVIWAGFREDIPVVMCALDLFVLTSTYEGFGLVLLEAMAAKRPIVASAVSAIPEVVLDECTGLIVPPLEAKHIADALSRLEKLDVRHAFGAAGYERAISTFSLDRMVQQTLDIYGNCAR
jgi:glycosyltransferase involved in cell wall biosynthesis